MIALTIIALSGLIGGIGVVVSKKRFDNKIKAIISDKSIAITSANCEAVDFESQTNAFTNFQSNLAKVETNIKEIDFPVADKTSSDDNGDTAMEKINAFFQKHNLACAGVEACILNALPHEQVINSLESAASFVSGAVKNSLLKGAEEFAKHWTIENHADFMEHFKPAIKTLAKGIAHHHINWDKLLFQASGAQDAFTGAKDGLKESVSSLKDSAHEIINTDSIHNVTESLTHIGDAGVIDSFDPSTLDFSSSAHIPIITIGISSFREINLLLNEKTDGLTSLKNISLDAAGTGAGGFVGAKAGAAIGTLICPGIGTAIGGLLGSIGGAIGGRKLTNNIKQKPLRDAIAAYQSQIDAMKRDTASKSKNMLNEISDYSENRRTEFLNKRNEKISVNASESIIRNIALTLFEAFKDYVKQLEKGLEKLKNSFWYSEKKHEETLEIYTLRIECLKKQVLACQNILEVQPVKAINQMNDIQIPKYKASNAFVKKNDRRLVEFKKLNDTNNSALLVWAYSISSYYQKMMNDIAKFSNGQMESFNSCVGNWKRQLKGYEDQVNVEKDKLGLK